ncbi:MAG: DNRLRE domain-containing protein [Candidatus Cloacimonadota bacterium]|nr:MAG: DNRLRE domain-containing protein [Candidatus Cloacimonadota bacterium]
MKNQIILFLFAILFMQGCRDEMNDPVGLDEVPNNIPQPVYIGGIYSDSISNFHFESHTGSSQRLWIGKSHSIESRILVRFEVDDSIQFANADFAQVKLSVYGGNPSRGVRVCVFPLTSNWVDTTVEWEKSFSDTQWNNPGGDYDDTDTITTLVIREQDEDFTFNCDSFSLIDTSFENNKGMIFVYDIGDTLLSIYSKESSSNPLKLTLFYGDSTKDYLAASDAFITNSSYIQGNNEFVLGEGYAMRALLIFNIDTIPPNVTINRAFLTFAFKHEYSYFDSVTINIYRIKGEWDEGDTEFEPQIEPPNFIVHKEDTVAEVSITSFVQTWVNEGENYGILLKAKYESSLCSRLVLDAFHKPTLSVYYTPPPESE